MKPCLGARSSLLDDSVGVDSDEGFRRMAMVGGILREERIIAGGMCDVFSLWGV